MRYLCATVLVATTALAGPRESIETAMGHTLRFFHQEAAESRTEIRLARNLAGVPKEASLPPRLVLILPGASNMPKDYRGLSNIAMSDGAYTLGLSYPNRPRVNYRCRNSADDCHGKTRTELVTGEDTSDVIDVAAFDSIEGRLRASLAMLAVQYPEDDWSSLLRDGEPVWSQITVVGQDEGGANGLVLAQRHKLQRLVLVGDLGEGREQDGTRSVASWVAAPTKTPADEIYGFVHQDEKYKSDMLQVWETMGLQQAGPPQAMSHVTSGELTSHLVTMSSRLLPDVDPREMLLTDASAQLDETARETLQDTWKYLLGSER